MGSMSDIPTATASPPTSSASARCCAPSRPPRPPRCSRAIARAQRRAAARRASRRGRRDAGLRARLRGVVAAAGVRARPAARLGPPARADRRRRRAVALAASDRRRAPARLVAAGTSIAFPDWSARGWPSAGVRHDRVGGRSRDDRVLPLLRGGHDRLRDRRRARRCGGARGAHRSDEVGERYELISSGGARDRHLGAGRAHLHPRLAHCAGARRCSRSPRAGARTAA